jgi:hypothetical protein
MHLSGLQTRGITFLHHLIVLSLRLGEQIFVPPLLCTSHARGALDNGTIPLFVIIIIVAIVAQSRWPVSLMTCLPPLSSPPASRKREL